MPGRSRRSSRSLPSILSSASCRPCRASEFGSSGSQPLARHVGRRAPVRTPAPKRRPFAKAGTPRRTERIRFFDVKHIKAELTLDTKKREVRGRGHPLAQPAAPLPHTGRARLRAQAQGHEGHRRPDRSGTCKFATKDGKLSVTLDKAYGLGDTIDLAIEYCRLARPRALFRHARGALSREAAVVLDPGRGRGHAPLAPLLRLSQRARHLRDDHHGGKAAVRPVQRRPGRDQGQRRTTRRPITGR